MAAETYRVLCPSTGTSDGGAYVVTQGVTLEKAERTVAALAAEGTVCPGPHTIEKETP